MEKGRCIRANASALRAMRKAMEDRDFFEIRSSALEKKITNPFSQQFVVQGASYEGYLTQRSILPLVEAAVELSKVYSFDAVFRDDAPDSRNHLRQYHYFQALFPGDIEDAERLISDIFCAVAAAVGSDASRWTEVHHITHQQSYSAINIEPLDDMNLDQQLELVSKHGEFAYVWDKPASLEPLRFDVCRREPRHHFEVLVGFAGEVGSGSKIETDAGAGREAFMTSDYRAAMVKLGDFDIDSAVEPFFSALGHLNGKFVSIGLSFERVLQAVLRTEDISDVVAFPVLDVARVGAMP